ncbi:glycosyl transferase family 2 [Arachidicoccus ginsenosidimutans]|uniref:GtrA family protein n=1 Tax=Arachidicoccus sp. BS20 TaxID=1850526 RepID=UPI0007F096F2|nr:GtrA family protein [Arachidicoccus sp. BS20]ANI89373.1 glycosyl transferase family 2 [Arachidicoccus sp. BS20]
MKIWIMRMISFAVIGTTGMIVDFGATWVLREKAKMNEYLANAIGFALAVINNFLLNKYWTFHDFRTLTAMQFSKYAAISLVGLSLNSLFLYLLHKFLRIPFYWAKFLATALVFLWNFIANSYITFS